MMTRLETFPWYLCDKWLHCCERTDLQEALSLYLGMTIMCGMQLFHICGSRVWSHSGVLLPTGACSGRNFSLSQSCHYTPRCKEVSEKLCCLKREFACVIKSLSVEISQNTFNCLIFKVSFKLMLLQLSDPSDCFQLDCFSTVSSCISCMITMYWLISEVQYWLIINSH